MDHHLCRQPHRLRRRSYTIGHYGSTEVNRQSQFGSPRTVLNPNTHHGEIQHCSNNRSLGNIIASVKRQREHHLIVSSSQDDGDLGCGDDQHDDNSMMDCYDDMVGQSKRRRFSYTFPFDSSGQIIQTQEKLEEVNHEAHRTTVTEECSAMNISSVYKGSPSVEWWRKKRPLVRTTSPFAAATDSKSLVEQEASSSCSAMDTSVGDDQICCHICQKVFPIPIIPSVRQVMPANALLNYFSPLNKKATSNGDVAMATDNSHDARVSSHRNWSNSPACCRCCDRPSCPECRRHCEVCQRSFCSFCSIARDGAKSSSCFCLDCYDQLR
mmetsp:Transcript_22506/g.55782  ORF Transcript_22506/g.55782 Transcript_22506/m.55782 type:complete len:325 (-) Transcript_22506:513-1487(-)